MTRWRREEREESGRRSGRRERDDPGMKSETRLGTEGRRHSTLLREETESMSARSSEVREGRGGRVERASDGLDPAEREVREEEREEREESEVRRGLA